MAPKPKPKSSGKPSTFLDEAKARRLGRNVNKGNVADVRKTGQSILAILRDPERKKEAADLLRRVAQEADPSKPGYEGNEILMPYVEALMQLQADKRASLVKRAGNPAVFANLPQPQPGELAAIPVPDRRPPPAAKAGSADALQQLAQEGYELSLAPSTFSGTDYARANMPDPRAPVDRTLPKAVRRLPVGHPERVAAEERIIQEIIGLPAMAQYRRIVEKGMEPTLPPVSRPTLKDADAMQKRLENPRALLRGASKAAREAITDEIERIGQLDIDPQMEPFGHVLAKQAFVSPEAMNELKIMAAKAGARKGGSSDNVFRQAVTGMIDGSFSMSDLDSAIDGLFQSGADPQRLADLIDLRRVVTLSDMKGGQNMLPRFSDEEPTALPSAEIRDNIIARLLAQRDEIDRRRSAFFEQPPKAAIGQRDQLSPMTVGTLGGTAGRGDAPYRPGKSMTVDQQVSQSVRSEGDRLLEKLYMAAREVLGDGTRVDSSSPDVADEVVADALTDVAADPDAVARRQGSRGRRIVVDLDVDFPEWRNQYAIPSHEGGYDIPQYAPTAQSLARRIAGWYGVKDPEEFETTVVPVLADAIRRQYNTPPSTPRAIEASKTLLVPNMRGTGRGQKGGGYKFFNNPYGRTYADELMFDKGLPMQHPEPEITSREWNGSMPQEVPAGVLSGILDKPTYTDDMLDADVGGIDDFDAALDAPVSDEPRPRTRRVDPAEFNFDPLDMPVDDGLSDLSMNKARRNPLAGLIA